VAYLFFDTHQLEHLWRSIYLSVFVCNQFDVVASPYFKARLSWRTKQIVTKNRLSDSMMKLMICHLYPSSLPTDTICHSLFYKGRCFCFLKIKKKCSTERFIRFFFLLDLWVLCFKQSNILSSHPIQTEIWSGVTLHGFQKNPS